MQATRCTACAWPQPLGCAWGLACNPSQPAGSGPMGWPPPSAHVCDVNLLLVLVVLLLALWMLLVVLLLLRDDGGRGALQPHLHHAPRGLHRLRRQLLRSGERTTHI